ncbi:hypothetical protein PUV54_00015 [Hyphococcus flavus]|uniref:Uncharacterized protein n=1 Tax=Hyphococcus flavus TaxID=1866326 RepID=A0AAE9ZEX3_9PROT|nr:hypothetical protein [Hyphococcus flavus]WDI31578.1 hypothetical protein PUV54_00015 [Hyphococcus flavus]
MIAIIIKLLSAIGLTDAAAKKFAPVAGVGLAIAGLLAVKLIHDAYVGAYYDKGFSEGQAEWESARVAALEAEKERLRAEAQTARQAAAERDQRYAMEIADITRRALSQSRRDYPALSAAVVRALNQGTHRANSDITRSAGASVEDLPADRDPPR